MNDTGGGVTAIHDVPGDITRIGFHWMLFFPFCHSKGGFYLFFTRSVSEVTGFLCPEFANFFLHTENRGDHGFSLSRFFSLSRICELFPSHGMSRNNLFYHELSNYRMSFTRNVAEITDFFLSRDLSLDPLTNGR